MEIVITWYIFSVVTWAILLCVYANGNVEEQHLVPDDLPRKILLCFIGPLAFAVGPALMLLEALCRRR